MTHQAQLDLDVPATPGEDRTGFQIGWDHAHHGLVPPAELLLQGCPLEQGWRAGKAVFGRRTLTSTRHTRQWLALRIRGWRQGIAFEGQQLTPNYLAQLDSRRCPVLRMPLGAPAGQPQAAVLERLNQQGAYAAGNLAQMSQAASDVHQAVGIDEALRRAQASRLVGEPVHGLDAADWQRLAVLKSFATPLPFARAARLPLVVLPPNRVRLLNAVQGLQALLTLQFATPGWAARTRAIGELLPQQALRPDYNLFVGALAPRVLEAGVQPTDAAHLRQALEDAWQHERVQRRWQHLVLSLGEAAVAEWLDRAAALGLAAVRTLNHAPEQAVEGWNLPAAAAPALPRSARLRTQAWRGARAPAPAQPAAC